MEAKVPTRLSRLFGSRCGGGQPPPLTQTLWCGVSRLGGGGGGGDDGSRGSATGAAGGTATAGGVLTAGHCDKAETGLCWCLALPTHLWQSSGSVRTSF